MKTIEPVVFSRSVFSRELWHPIPGHFPVAYFSKASMNGARGESLSSASSLTGVLAKRNRLD